MINLIKKLDFFLDYRYQNFIPKEMPKRFLRLSGKNLWLSLLSKSIRDNGGEVISFNHSNSIVNGMREPFLMSELQECDKYISSHTINKTVEDLKKNYPNTLIPKILING